MTKSRSNWAAAGLIALSFFAVGCLYHMVYWVWVAAAFKSDKQLAWTHITIWLVLAAAAAAAWCRLLWITYIPKKTGKK